MVRVQSSGGGASSLLTTTGKDRLTGRDPHEPGPGMKPVDSIKDESNGSIFGGASRSSILSGAGKYLGNITGRMWEALLCGPETRDKKGKEKNSMNAGALWLRRTGCGADAILGLLDFSKGIPSLNKDEMKRRVNSVLKNEAADISQGVKDTLISSVAAAAGTDSQTMLVSINQAQHVIKTGKPENAQEFVALMGAVVGSDALIEVLDISAEIAILDHAMDMAVSLGIPDVIDIILASIKDRELAREMVLRNLRNAAIRSDLTTIEKGIDYIGGAGVLYRVPDMIGLILSNYHVDKPKDQWDIPAAHAQLTRVLNSIDPNWRTTQRNGISVSGLSNFIGISKDASVILNHDEDYIIQTTLGKEFERESVQEVVNLYHRDLILV